MADFATTDLYPLGLTEDAPGGSSTDLFWFGEAPPVPPPNYGAVECFQRVTTLDGRSEWAKYLGGLITGGKVAYFKLGEGGWRESDEVVELVGQGIGIAIISGTIDGPPLIPGSITIDVDNGRYVTDVPNSPYNAQGVLYYLGSLLQPIGTINYKTGYYSAVFPSIVTGSDDITITRKHRGIFKPVSEAFADGDGTSGPYVGTLKCTPIKPGSMRVSDTQSPEQVLVDDGAGNLSGDGTGSIDYETGQISVTFTSDVSVGWEPAATYIAEGVPLQPEEDQTALFADSDDTLATYQKSLNPSVDMAFQGAGTATVRVTMALLASEGNDDGYGYSPFWTEGGLFSSNGKLLLYFTMPGISKTGSKTWTRLLDLTAKV